MSNTLDPKDPDVPTLYEIDWLEELVSDALRSTAFAQGEVVRAQRDTGWFYECTIAGRTSSHYPQWPRADGETVADGSVEWTCRHPSSAQIPSVDSAVWTVPDGISLLSQVEIGSLTQITLTGGTAGTDYEITCQMTPTIGNPIEQTIVIPVRSL